MVAKYRYDGRPASQASGPSLEGRIRLTAGLFSLIGIALVSRLFQLQVLEAKTYKVLASDQHEVQAALVPKRGTIYTRDRWDGKLHTLAKDKDVWQIYAISREVKEPEKTAEDLAQILGTPIPDILNSFASSSYSVLSKEASAESVDLIRKKRLPGIGITKAQTRYYPEEGLGGQVLGFVNLGEDNRRVGRYGIEGSFQAELAGEYGSISLEKDRLGRRLTIGSMELKAARDGSNIVLTLDRTIQYEACRQVKAAVLEFQAKAGTILVMDPNSGAIWAMCSWPDFEPVRYNEVRDISILNNPALFSQYEPGSVFKPVTIAAGLEAQKINPRTTYVDGGEEKIDDFTIRNSDKQAHGVQSMTDVLQKSLNLGTIFVQRLLGKDLFREYVERFGFGKLTGIELKPEVAGDTRPLSKKGSIFAATGSFGQGIAVTPLQMLAAFNALGNGGRLFKPQIVQEIIKPDGTVIKTQPELVGQPISARTSRLISGMMVTVVEQGHGKRAGVPGYFVAGKTGTAQVPNPKGGGYLPGVTIGTFAGYAPASDPAFVMLVKIDEPKTVQYAEASAAPVFGRMARFILSYLQIKPERPITDEPLSPPVTPIAPMVSTSTRDI